MRFNVMNDENVRMIEGSGGLRFLFKSRKAVLSLVRQRAAL